jgi:uncharacterized protein (DUF427 family)
MKATWNGAVLAESDGTVLIEGRHYFPADSLSDEHFEDSDTHTICSWKGEPSYKTVVVDGERNPDAAWYYPDPLEAAEQIRATTPSGTASRSTNRARDRITRPARR